MRNYSCYFYHEDAEGHLDLNTNTACFAGIKNVVDKIKAKKTKQYEEFIYIDKFKQEETAGDVTRLIRTINKITPCSIVKRVDKEYIKVKLFPNYDKSLIVLNFIRNLWHSPVAHYETENIYYKFFFEQLKTLRIADPITKLTTANKEACIKAKFKASPTHSNCHSGMQLKIKTLDDFTKSDMTSTYSFLTT